MSTAEVYRDKAGRWRWRLKAANGEVIADSGQSYGRERDCLIGLALSTDAPPIETKHLAP
jgi:uncharacterized protein YegP (UPF0339 family)